MVKLFIRDKYRHLGLMAHHYKNRAGKGPGPDMMVRAELGAHCMLSKTASSPRP